MEGLRIFDYRGTQIEFEIINGEVYANATEMCQAFAKKPVNWLDLTSTQRYINALGAKSGNLTLVKSKQGGSNSGTWIHEKLILKLAQWLDVEFEIWCDEKIGELLKAGTATVKPLSPAEMFLHNAQILVTHEKRLEKIEDKQTVTDEKIREIEAKVSHRPNYFSIMGFAVLGKLTIGYEKAKQLGIAAKKLCVERGFDVEKIDDPRFGKVNTYPFEVLRIVFNQAG